MAFLRKRRSVDQPVVDELDPLAHGCAARVVQMSLAANVGGDNRFRLRASVVTRPALSA